MAPQSAIQPPSEEEKREHVDVVSRPKRSKIKSLAGVGIVLAGGWIAWKGETYFASKSPALLQEEEAPSSLSSAEAPPLQQTLLSDEPHQERAYSPVIEQADLAVVRTLIRLEHALRQGKAYAPWLQEVIEAKPDDQIIKTEGETLKARASQGVPTAHQLHQAFLAMAGKLVALSQEGKTVQALKWQRFFMPFVTVRKIGEKAETAGGVEQLIVHIEQALIQEDIAKAVTLAESLTEPAQAQLIASWLSEARVTLAARQAVQELYKHVVGIEEKDVL